MNQRTREQLSLHIPPNQLIREALITRCAFEKENNGKVAEAKQKLLNLENSHDGVPLVQFAVQAIG